MGLINENLAIRNVPILDELTLSLDGSEALTASVAATINGAYINLGASGYAAIGNRIRFACTAQGLTSGGAAVVQFQLESDTNGAGAGTVVAESALFDFDAVPSTVYLDVPDTTTDQYFRVNVLVTTVALTGGGVVAGATKIPA